MEFHATSKKTINGQVLHPQRIYFERLGHLLKPQTRWLDIGCGRQLVPWWLKEGVALETELISRAHWLIGVDPDLAALRDNHSCHLKLNTDAASLPFADGSFDLVTSNMVFEHVEYPQAILDEIRRVLRRGACLLVHTPNWLDIVTIAARAVPNHLHPMIVSQMEMRGEEDIYPTHFRFNRPSVVEKLLRDSGFKSCRIELLEQPDTYVDVPIFSRIESVWHGLARRWPALRGTILIEAETG